MESGQMQDLPSSSSSPPFTSFNNAPAYTTVLLPPTTVTTILPAPGVATYGQSRALSSSGVTTNAAPLATKYVLAICAHTDKNLFYIRGRRSRRSVRKERKRQAIAQQLQSRVAPPIGDPAVNHYRRGAKATVPLAGPIDSIPPPT